MPTITESLVRRAKPRKAKYELSCAALRGFVLRVLPSGKKVYYARHRRAGKDVRERIGLASEMTLGEAKRAALELLGHLPKPRSEPAPRPTVTEARRPSSAPLLRSFAERYLDEYAAVYLKPTTLRRYRWSLKKYILPALGRVRLDAITTSDALRLHRAMRDTPYNANNTIRVLSSLYRYAYTIGALGQEHPLPTRGVRLFRERKRERFLTPTERKCLERVLSDGEAIPAGRSGSIRWATAAAIRLLAFTGMRRAELLALTWAMVDERHRCLRLPDSKTGPKIVPISSQTIALIKSLEQYRDCEYVLYSRNRRPLDPGALSHAWKRIRARAGLHDVRLHDLRHSAASDAINAGVQLEVIQKILGHADIRTTQRYAHLASAVIADGVERMGASIERSSTGTNSAE